MELNIQRIMTIYLIVACFITLPLALSLIWFILTNDLTPFMYAFLLGYWFYVFIGISGWVIIILDVIDKRNRGRENND